MTFRILLTGALLLVTFCNSVFAADAEFPGRAIYLGTPHISIDDFNKDFDNAVVVDVRSQYEYETLRIIGAKNLPLNSAGFVRKMQKLRSDNKDKKIVVYCNGKSCMKSYKAASKAKARGITNVIAYDAGIMDWAKTYPEKSVLLGITPIDPNKLIAKSRFKERLLEPKKFAEMSTGKNISVLDVRDRLQRMGMGLFVGIEEQAGLDNDAKLNHYIKKATDEKKTLLIYDESGKQVRWLMYRLEAKGMQDYYFMKGGTRAYFKELRKRQKNKS